MEKVEERRRRRPPPWAAVLLWALISSAVLGGVASPFMIVAIPFLFDAPGSTGNPFVLDIVKGMFALPVVAVLTGIVASLTLWRYHLIGLIIACAPAVSWAGYMAWIDHELNVVCGGNFGCQSTQVGHSS